VGKGNRGKKRKNHSENREGKNSGEYGGDFERDGKKAPDLEKRKPKRSQERGRRNLSRKKREKKKNGFSSAKLRDGERSMGKKKKKVTPAYQKDANKKKEGGTGV